MPETPLTCIDLWIRAGSSFENAGEEGLAHFLEHMVFKGSHNHEAGEFDRAIEVLGGSSNAATGFDDVHFHVLVPPKVIGPALELLLDLVLNPALLQDSYFTEREVVLEEIAQQHDQPDEKVFQRLLSTCWAKHAYGRPILGYEESLKKSYPLQMKSFHERLYTGNNCCLSIAGQIPKDIETLVNNSLLGAINPISSPKAKKNEKISLQFNVGRHEYQLKRLEAARLLMAWPVTSAKDQCEVMGADIATSLLAEGRRSRLIQSLREDLQLVESIEMDVTALEEGGIIILEAYCRPEDLEAVENETHKILKESLELPIDLKEIERAGHLVKNSLCFNLEASSQVAAIAGSQALWNRSQPLLEPLKYINYWTESHLQENIFSKIQPELSCTLVAKPMEIDL